MDLPCQKIVLGVLPATRAAITEDPVRCGASRIKPARMMEVAPSPVSLYTPGRRGYRTEFDEEAKESIGSPVQDLRDGRVESRVGRICRQVRQESDRCGTGRECAEP
ncbi:MAG: transcriptional regulator [Methanoculleus sp.]|jgi:predicted transcriptional regulator|uniref:transcriptional regulator n=1 Tax=Methanoculleus sp. TaxID=90427 RepID=UPI0026187A58|nr:transcriptional regulator [Methanoculleus sp.]MDD2254323.1 transcriptional regulator [Methanoculleus sp.]MDD4471141.1 transcriptional regulator [Methanoculleus sp.]